MAVETKVHVKLIRPVEHGGSKYVKDDEIDVDPDIAAWLIEINVAVKAPVKPASANSE